MKKIYSILAIAISAFAMSSCVNDLNIIQTDSLNSTNMWKDESDVVSATTGIYVRLRSAMTNDKESQFFWGELRVGPKMWGKGCNRTLCDNDMLDVLLNTLSSGDASTSWTDLYTCIDQCNQVIKYAPNVTMTEENLHYCLGNAYFVRAYCYYWLARVFGDVPLVTTPTEGTGEAIYPSRAAVSEVYAQIESDLQQALTNITGNASGCYYATVDNINMLRADFALWMYGAAKAGDAYLTEAETALAAVSSPSLLDNFSQVFSVTNKKNKEIAFAIHLANGEYTSGAYYWYFIWGSSQIAAAYRNNKIPVYSNQWFMYSDEFVDFLKASKAKGDQRTDVSYQEFTGSGNMYETIQWPAKFLGTNSTGTMVWDADMILYRYAQYYMFKAELAYDKGNYPEALKQLNIVAKRAYGSAIYTDATASAVKQALVDENLKEFAEEGNVYFSLIRLDAIYDFNPSRYVEGLGQAGFDKSKSNQLLMPVSQSALNRNHNLKQTEGWS